MSWRVPETAEPVLSVGAGAAHRLVSLHAVPFPHLRLWLKAGNIALVLGCACVLVALVLLLRLTRGGLGWAAVAAGLAALLLGFHSVADRIVGDGFTRDAELSIYPPEAGAPEVRMLLNGRAWLQQRTPVVADGDRALILMPRYVRTATCRGHGLALDVLIASFTEGGRGDAWHAAAGDPLPCGARGWDPSTTFLVPFRTAAGRLDVLVMGMDGN